LNIVFDLFNAYILKNQPFSFWKNIIIVLFFLLKGQFGYSNTFVVTSTADTGVGTLREALEKAQANGSLKKDSVSFHLPGLTVEQRTISVLSPLILSSNLVIDGSTQPGNQFGITDAKVVIRNALLGNCTNCFLIESASEVGIYGLWIKDFVSKESNIYGVIYMHNVKEIEIGSPQKGNLFTNNSIYSILHNSYGNVENSSAEGISIRSNIFELDTTGFISTGITKIKIERALNVAIGGASKIEGNYVGNGSITCTIDNFESSSYYGIHNNNLGLNYNKTAKVGSVTLFIAGSFYGTEYTKASVRIDNNECTDSGESAFAVFQLYALEVDLIINNNKIGLFNSTKNPYATGICLSSCKKNKNLIINKNIICGFSGYAIASESAENLTISDNSIYCNRQGIYKKIYTNQSRRPPYVVIKERTNVLIRGEATAASSVEVFSTTSCFERCLNGQLLLGTVLADSNGKWQLNIANSGNITATATDLQGYTSEFNKIDVAVSAVKITNATCGKPNGSITNVVMKNAANWHWEDNYGNLISADTNLINIKAGFYKLVVPGSNIGCNTLDRVYEVKSINKPLLDLADFIIANSNCSQQNGSIKFQKYDYNQQRIFWLDSIMQVISTDVYEVKNLNPGTYYCKVQLNDDTSCYSISLPLKVNDNPETKIISNSAVIKNASCNKKNGSITGLSLSNVDENVTFKWLDSIGTLIGTSLDITDIAAGTYKFIVEKSGSCGYIATSDFEILNEGEIFIDMSELEVIPSKCSEATGSIDRIKVFGSTKIKWINMSTSETIDSSIKVVNLAAGKYQLIASNSFGCIKYSPQVVVSNTPFASLNVLEWNGKTNLCDNEKGFLSIQKTSNVSSEYKFEWVDSATSSKIGDKLFVDNLSSGTYLLFAVDSNGCKQKIFGHNINAGISPTYDFSAIKITNDKCSKREGSIRGAHVYQSTTHRWLNSIGDVISKDLEIFLLPAGTYHLELTNSEGCISISSSVVIKDEINKLEDPIYDNVVVVKNSSGHLNIKNPGSYLYELYINDNFNTPYDENRTGNFISPPLIDNRTFYIRAKEGSCSSNFVPIKIKVANKVYFYVPTAFTPNGDKINDNFKILSTGPAILKFFRVYNRWGQEIFTSHNINNGWDGNLDGKNMPTGVYVWTFEAIDGLTGEKVIQKGTVTLIR
jgi:gliding motility-associated-like protein